ncbi:MAG: OadG family transporter subunit [bacterium]|nr:OadG family transporter subunit [bacterium]
MVRGLELTLAGMGVVLGGLALLALVVRGLARLLAGRQVREEAGAETPAPRVEDNPAPAVVAAIAGAVAVALGSDPGQLRLLSVQEARPVGGGPASWALAGRMDQMRSRRGRDRGGGRKS